MTHPAFCPRCDPGLRCRPVAHALGHRIHIDDPSSSSYITPVESTSDTSGAPCLQAVDGAVEVAHIDSSKADGMIGQGVQPCPKIRAIRSISLERLFSWADDQTRHADVIVLGASATKVARTSR